MGMPTIKVSGIAERQRRKQRNPQHQFQLKHRPWQITPFMLAPVLPGETMKNLLLQSRVVSDPINNPLVGWWCEYFFFYVKVRDLTDRDFLTSAFTDPSVDMETPASLTDTGAPHGTVSWDYYYQGNGVPWSDLCLQRVVEEYFRDEGETWDEVQFTGSNLPVAKINQRNWMDSLKLATEEASADIDADLDADSTITAGEIDRALQQWAILQQTGLTDMSYEQFLATYGVRPKEEELHIPELIRYVRDWTYPTNTVDPTDGDPSSAVSWSIAERADKDRFFREPGFIFGVTVVRPKVYWRRLYGSLANNMTTLYHWLPAALQAHVDGGRIEFAKETSAGALDGKGPWVGADDDYIVDLRDLLMYGDQWINYTTIGDVNSSSVEAHNVSSEDLRNRGYPMFSDAKQLFVDWSADNATNVRQDGIVSLNVMGTVEDMTPTTSAEPAAP